MYYEGETVLDGKQYVWSSIKITIWTTNEEQSCRHLLKTIQFSFSSNRHAISLLYKQTNIASIQIFFLVVFLDLLMKTYKKNNIMQFLLLYVGNSNIKLFACRQLLIHTYVYVRVYSISILCLLWLSCAVLLNSVFACRRLY